MKICGIELKANNCIMTLIEFKNNNILSNDIVTKKIILNDDENKSDILEFFYAVSAFVKEHKIEKIVIKKRAKKGNFSGGAVTFKMEALIQVVLDVEVELISSQAISSFEKKNSIEFPKGLKKYQEQAYLATLAFMQ